MRMKLLAIETAMANCGVAVSVDATVYQQQQQASREQSQLLLAFIDELLKKSNIKLNQLDAIAYSYGPGSFTGVRLAASTVQGLAMLDDIPVIVISSLQVLAQTAFQLHQCQAVAICVDAHMGQVYYNKFVLDEDNIMQPMAEDQLLTPEQVEIPADMMMVGNGWARYVEVFTIADEIPQYFALLNDVTALIPLAKKAYERKQIVSAEQALPNYLRSQNAWHKQA